MRCSNIFVAMLLLAGMVTPAAAQKRLALVVGNDRYDNVPVLQKAVNDARAVGEHFAQLGYEVIRAENATRRQMNEKIGELTNRIGRGDTAAFFFAGHGVAIRDTNYLLPTDTPAAREGQDDLIARESISASSIVETLQDRGARVVLMVLDACRDNPFKTAGSRGVGGSRGLSQMQTQDGVFVLYSAGIGQTALDRLGDQDANPNSVFTRTFINLMGQPDMSIQELAKTTQSEVRKLAASVNHFQMPAYYDQIDGLIKLAATAKRTAPARQPAPVGPGSGRPFTALVKTRGGKECLVVSDGAKDPTLAIWLMGCDGTEIQKWEFIPDGADYFTVKARHSGLCLEIIDGSPQRGMPMWQNSCSGGDSQKFKLTADSAGFYEISVKNSGYCIGYFMGIEQDGAAVHQWHCSGAGSWKLEI